MTATFHGEINSQEMATAAYQILCVGACAVVRGQECRKGQEALRFRGLVGYLDEQITATEFLALVMEAGYPVEPLMPIINTNEFWSLEVRKYGC